MRWWRHLRLRLSVLRDRNENLVDRLWLSWYLATLQRPNLDQKALDGICNGIDNCLNQIAHRLFPWQNHEAAREKAAAGLRDAWVTAYGDPNDPEVKAKIEATVAMLRGRDKAKKNGS